MRVVASVDTERDSTIAALVAHWRANDAETLLDLENGPLREHKDDLVIVEAMDDGEYLYLHYGKEVSGGAGLAMAGKTTGDFSTAIGKLFSSTYKECLACVQPMVSINKSKSSHLTHSWHRTLLPLKSDTPGVPDRVIALVRCVVLVEDVLSDLAHDSGLLGGTLEVVIENDSPTDFVLLSLTDPHKFFDGKQVETLSDLIGRPLLPEEVSAIHNAPDGESALSLEAQKSMERFGCRYVVKVSGGDKQPVFFVSDSTDLLDAQDAADERKQAMEDFANTASDWMWQTDANHVFTFMSQSINQLTGLQSDHYVGKTRIQAVGSLDNQDLITEHHKQLLNHEPFRDFVYSLPHPATGRTLWIRVNGTPVFGKDGAFQGYRGTGTNITEEVEAREQAARRAEELAEAHRIGQLGAWWFDRETGQAQFSPQLFDILGLSTAGVSHQSANLFDMMADTWRKKIAISHAKVFDGLENDVIDVQVRATNGALVDLSMTTRPVRDQDGEITGLTGTVQNITARKRAERELQQLAYYDPLTGLGNRSFFSRELDRVLDSCNHGGAVAGLLLLDLDHFKEVNDSLGHAAGDELLRRVAERLVRSAGSGSIVCRLGGDEFAIVVPQIEGARCLAKLAAAINEAFTVNVRLQQGTVHIATSVGMVIIPTQTRDGEEAMRFADLALYEAKAAGRNGAILFDPSLDETVQERVNLARDLRQAIDNDELEAHFQVQVDVLRGCVCGFEALARWNHPTRGYVSPDVFIPIAESSRLIADLGAWMVRSVCKQGRAWLDAGGAALEMSVNVSVAQLWHRDVEADIKNALEESGFPAELLCVELTETVFEDGSLARIQRLFNRLKEIGVRIALDDFGTGYSSLKYLNDLSFDKLKIDRSFVDGCDESADQRRLLQGILALGQGMGLETTVEGVENERELQVVCDLGCQNVQGFFFSYPKPFHEACLDAAQIEADYGFEPVVWKAKEKALSKAHWRDRAPLPGAKASAG